VIKQKQQAETCCFKLIDYSTRMKTEEELTYAISREVEQMNGIEKVMFVK
jgi:hypothetical protein